jgi:DNA primase
VPGRIRDDDVAAVRDATRIEDVIGQHVTLKKAGGGSLKGLCPFHDERSPSFHVTPSRGLYHCFGCGKGGDVIAFLREVEGLSFADAVERLADKAGITLRRDDEPATGARRQPAGQRQQILAANRLAETFFADALGGTEAAQAREHLAQRGFDRTAAARFGVGYAPRDGQTLARHLRAHGIEDDLAVTAGLLARGATGVYARFRGRLIWPIRELSGDTIGFGARRLYDDDRIEAKYLNTPETPVYKKSTVLYGADLARRDIGTRAQAVVVEGYTDVMAAHLAGVTTAVATCGTSFGPEHADVLRRLLMDDDRMHGEVVFTFDGDAAGQKAAERAFHGTDERFVAQTYVAIEPDGLDPCELRLARGDAAVRELVARREPLYRFVLRTLVTDYDLDRVDARIDAVRAGAALLGSVRDRAKREGYLRELADLTGTDPDEVRALVAAVQATSPRAGTGANGAVTNRRPTARPEPPPAAPADAPDRTTAGMAPGSAEAGGSRLGFPPEPRSPRQRVEHELLQYAVQCPLLLADPEADLPEGAFADPAHAAVHALISEVGGPAAAPPGADGGRAGAAAGAEWVRTLLATATRDDVRGLVRALAVEGLPGDTEPDAERAASLAARLAESVVAQQISARKSRLQRMNPVTEKKQYDKLFSELIVLEARRRELRERSLGSQ